MKMVVALSNYGCDGLYINKMPKITLLINTSSHKWWYFSDLAQKIDGNSLPDQLQ
jgi:hypothetical protein